MVKQATMPDQLNPVHCRTHSVLSPQSSVLFVVGPTASGKTALAVTLAECCFDTNGVGVSADVPAAIGEAWAGASDGAVADEQTLFGESAPMIVVSTAPGHADAVVARATAAGIPARVIGRTGGAHIRVAIDGREALAVTVAEAETAWGTAIEARMTSRRAGAA